MDKNKITIRKLQLDELIHIEKDTQVEYWLARELMSVLGYERWENFEKSIRRAKESCESQGIAIEDHFREVTKMVQIGSSAKRKIKDYMLTRYACYLIAMNGDTQKEEIAFAQSYFAVQTRKQELIEERIALIERTRARDKLRESEKRLSQNIYERGVDDAGFGRIRSKGDSALFGGRTTQEMKRKLGVKDNRPLADFLPTLTIAAKNLATEMTNYRISVSSFMGYLKGKSALMMFERHANLKYKFGNRHFWAEGYYVSTVGLNEETIRKYIRDQEKHDMAVDKLSVKEYEDPFGM